MLNMLNIIDTSEILKAVSNVIQLYARGELYPRGIRTVCGEASYFGMYAAFVLPWILSYIYTEKEYWKKGIAVVYALYFIALVLLSKSRMGLLIFWLEFIIFSIGIIIMKGNWKKKIITVLLFPFLPPHLPNARSDRLQNYRYLLSESGLTELPAISSCRFQILQRKLLKQELFLLLPSNKKNEASS